MTAPAPGTAEWQRLVTASKVAAIVGLSPWDSPRSVWHLLRGEIPSDDGRNMAAKSRGQYLENGILDWWVDQHLGVDLHTAAVVTRQYYATRDDLPWAAATPDLATRLRDVGLVVVDAKTARDDDEWGTPGTDEVPAYYAAQLQWSMHLAGARRGYIALLTSRLDLREYVLDYDEVTARTLESICRAFWESTKDPDGAPPIDDTVATFQTLKRLHPDIDRDAAVELDEEVAREFVAATTGLKAAEAADRLARSTVLGLMGDARLATYDGVTICRRQPNAYGISLVPVAKTIPTRDKENAA
ncbi:YqaJ viral recombinase family protein [Luteimicrobium sp. NPDC057192]|uniref:YqaJ viral recombinase family protein n=1 Tax=Luteimicrobium sp. NPDC057192 TaxID=3346042 RepID=UPI00363A8B73